MLELPSGSFVNPMFIRSIAKSKHFWSDKFYLTLAIQAAPNVEFEQLTSDEADALLGKIQSLVDASLSSATAYEEAYNGGRSHGYETGYDTGFRDGFDSGYQRANSAFWSYDREEYRIDDYHLGYEAGKRNAEEQSSNQWSKGYNCGRYEAIEEAHDTSEALKAEISKLKEVNDCWRERALAAETLDADRNGHKVQVGYKGPYNSLKRSIAKLLHPDHSSGSLSEKAHRQEIFKEIWQEIERIEKRQQA